MRNNTKHQSIQAPKKNNWNTATENEKREERKERKEGHQSRDWRTKVVANSSDCKPQLPGHW